MTRPPTRIALVPGALALLPEYAALADPVAPLRAACREAVSWLVWTGTPVTIYVSGPQGLRVATHLVGEAGGEVRATGSAAAAPVAPDADEAVLVVANGSACRSEKAPGHLDARAAAYDDALREALLEPDPAALAGLDPTLARELWADVGGLLRLDTAAFTDRLQAEVTYDDDPYGVQYWVVRWS